MNETIGGLSKAMQKRKRRLPIERESASESKQIQDLSETNVPAASAGDFPDESTFCQAVEAAYDRLKQESSQGEAAGNHSNWLTAAEELAHELIQQATLAQTPVPRGLQRGFQAATDDAPQGRQGNEHLGPWVPMHDRRERRVGWARMSWVPDETSKEEDQGAIPESRDAAAESARPTQQSALPTRELEQRTAGAPPRLEEQTRLQRAQRRVQEDAVIAAALQAQEDRYGSYGGTRWPAARQGRRGGRGGQRGSFGSWW